MSSLLGCDEFPKFFVVTEIAKAKNRHQNSGPQIVKSYMSVDVEFSQLPTAQISSKSDNRKSFEDLVIRMGGEGGQNIVI